MNIRTVLIVSFCFLLFAGCSRSSDKKSVEGVPVRVFRVEQQQIPEILQYSGNIVPYRVIQFGFMVAGKIKEVPVVEGQFVYKGDLIATIEPTDYNFALSAAKAQLDEANKEFGRLNALYQKGSLTQSNYDKIVTAREEATANYDYKHKQVSDTRLYAPADGWLAVEGIEPGEIIPQGYPVFAIIQTRLVFAEASIPENEINRIKLGERVIVRLPALNDTIFPGTISRLDPVADGYTRSFPVKATVENPNNLLKAGMIAFLQIPTGKINNLITIPANSISLDASGHTYVYVVNTGRVNKRPVSTGKAINKQVEITRGLNPGEFIVTEGLTRLYEGALILIQE